MLRSARTILAALIALGIQVACAPAVGGPGPGGAGRGASPDQEFCDQGRCASGLECRFEAGADPRGRCVLEPGRCRFVTDCLPMYACMHPGSPGPWIGVCVPRGQ